MIANGRDDTRAVGDDRAVLTRDDVPGPRLVAVRDRVRDAGAAGRGEELGAEADQAARRDDELHAHPAGAVVGHVVHAALAGGEQLRDRAEVLLGRVDRQVLERLVGLAVDLLRDHLRLADGELEALAAHVLDEDREGELAAALHLPRVRTADVDDLERDVADELAVEAVLDHARGELVALDLADERATCSCRSSSRSPGRRRGSAAADARRRGRRWSHRS